jgi:hypothetical protein
MVKPALSYSLLVISLLEAAFGSTRDWMTTLGDPIEVGLER